MLFEQKAPRIRMTRSVRSPFKSVTISLVALALLCSVAGCGNGRLSEATSDVVTATDLVGATVSLDGPAKRVVAIPIPAASMLVAINGGPEVLAGMNPSAKEALEDGYLGEIFPELKDVPSDVSTQDFVPVMEKLLKLKPDLVIQWGDEGAGLVAPLLDAGMTVAQLKYGTQEYLEDAITLYGTLLGREDRADRLLDRMHQGLSAFKDDDSIPGEERPRVLFFSAVQEGLKVAGAGSYDSYMIDLVGGANPAGGQKEQAVGVDLEQVLAWDPQVILLGNFDPTVPADIYADPRWASISAVKDKRVYKVPLGGYRWDPPSQESPLMWEWMDGLINREEIPATLSESIREYYEFLYGHSPSDAQLAGILQSEANTGSRGYRDAED